jgi:hypothetical protein
MKLLWFISLTFASVCATWTAPPARWPSEWICFTNITRNGQPADYGTQIYSWSNRAQSVLHADMKRSEGASTLIWPNGGNRSYVVDNNYNSCCYLSQFDFPMPNVGWTDYLSYDSNDTFNGTPSYLYTNPSMMDVKYWISMDTGLPVGWSNVPDVTLDPSPIIQYFYAAVEYFEPLSPDYFILPSSCTNALACPILDNADAIPGAQSESCDTTEMEAALIWVPIVLFVVGLAGGLLGGKYYYEASSVRKESVSGDISLNPLNAQIL